MTPTKQTERPHTHREEQSVGSDPASNRPMSVSEIRASYAEYADWLHRFEVVDRAVTGRYRRARFGDVSGTVLDVACGTGTNFRYLPESVNLVGIDISPEMLANAEEQLADLGRDGALQQMDAQDLAFPDDSFDAVISALSTCTFPDPVAALQEMERVCKPDGRSDSSSTGAVRSAPSRGTRTGGRMPTTRRPGVAGRRTHATSSLRRGCRFRTRQPDCSA